jgi:hypothetical protein
MKRQKLPEVADKVTAVANVLGYNDALNNLDTLPLKVRADLLRTVSMARGWFAVEKGGHWYLAPAKFAGFEGMTPGHYADNRTEISGTRGEAALKRISGNTHVDETHPAWRALNALAARFDRTPSSAAYVYVLHKEPDDQPEAPLPILVETAVDAVVSLAANLPPEGLAALKRRVAAL